MTLALVAGAGFGLGYHTRPAPAPAPAPDHTAALRRLEWYARATEGLLIRHGGFDQPTVDAVSREANR